MRRRIMICVILSVVTVLWFAGVAMSQPAGAGETQTTTISYWDWYIVKGGPVGWLIILIDVASVAIIIEHFIAIRRTTILPEPVRTQIGRMVEEKKYKEMLEYTGTEPSALAYMVHQSLSEASYGYAAMERAMEEACEERTTQLLRKIELLNVLGNVSPMLGLFGTVLGMIMVFSKIVQVGGMPDAAELADGVGTALVTTFWGLIVAMPALSVYAFMRTRIDALSSEAMTIAQETISAFRPGTKK